MSRAQQAQETTNTYTTYSTSVPVGYQQTTSSYTPVVGTTTSNLYTAQPTAYYTTQQYSGPTTTYVQGSQLVGGAVGTSNGYVVSGSAAHKAVAEEIPVESRIEYIPFEKKYIEYEQIEKVYQVPVETEVIEYEEVVRNERIPIERTITDYYAVETQVEYIRREIEETVMIEEPVEKVYERVQYIPVETQIVHYPERDNYVPAKTQVRTEYVGVQGGSVAQESKVQGATYQTTYTAGQSGSRVGQTTYVSSGSGVNATSSYQPASYTTGTYNVPAGYTLQQGYTSVPASYGATYQTGYVTGQPVTYTTTTNGYVTGGSGVRTGGYVTGGSGVRGATYTTGSNIKQSSYETNAGYY